MSPKQQNPWTYDERARTLVLEQQSYEIPLDDLVTSAKILDRIVHLAENVWAGPEVVAGFVYAIDELFNLEHNVCGSGVDKGPIDVKAVLAQVAEARAEQARDLDQVRATGIPMAPTDERRGGDFIAAVRRRS